VSAITPVAHGAFTYVVHLLVIFCFLFVLGILGARIEAAQSLDVAIRVILINVIQLGL